MSEAKNFKYYRILINYQPGQVSQLCSFLLLSCSSKCVTAIYSAHYGDAIFVLLENNANICFQFRHKFDQLFTANDQVISLNKFSNTFTIQRAQYHVI